ESRYADPRLYRSSIEAFIGENRLYATARNPPFRCAAIRRQSTLQAVRGGSILVEHVAPYNRAETLDIEVCVLDLERIECPLNQVDRSAQRLVALCKLQNASDTCIARLGADAKHMA